MLYVRESGELGKPTNSYRHAEQILSNHTNFIKLRSNQIIVNFLPLLYNMAAFEPFSAIPGDNLTSRLANIDKPKLGDGLAERDMQVYATKAGLLTHKPPSAVFISTSKSYTLANNDQIIGVIEDRVGENYRVNVFSAAPAFLPLIAFEGATKRNKPNLTKGAAVFCRVVRTGDDFDPELTCIGTGSDNTGGKKDWMTDECMFSELKGGNIFRVSIAHAVSLLKPKNVVLNELGLVLQFEIAIGRNGVVYVNGNNRTQVVVICNCIERSENMTPSNVKKMVKRLVEELKQ